MLSKCLVTDKKHAFPSNLLSLTPFVLATTLTNKLTNQLTYLLTYSMEQSPSWESNSSSASHEFPEFCGIQNFTTTFTSARHLSLSWARSIQSTIPHPTASRSILILSSNLCLGLPSDVFLSGIPTKTLYVPFLSHTCATCPVHLILPDLISHGSVYSLNVKGTLSKS